MEYNFVELQTYRGINKSIYSGTVAGTTSVTVDTKLTPVDVMPFKEATFFVNVTAISGTNASLAFKIQTQDPVSLVWSDLVAFTAKTATGAEVKFVAANLGQKIALTMTLTGTGAISITLTVAANFKIM